MFLVLVITLTSLLFHPMGRSFKKLVQKSVRIFSMSISLDSGGCRGPGDYLGMRVCARDSRELVLQYNSLVCKNRPDCMLDPLSSPNQLNKTMPRYSRRWDITYTLIILMILPVLSKVNNVSWFTARLSCHLEVTRALDQALTDDYIEQEPEILNFTQASFKLFHSL